MLLYLSVIIIFNSLSKNIHHIISEKFWTESSQTEKKQLFEMLIVVALIQVATIFNLLFHIFSGSGEDCLLCDAGMIAVALLTIAFILNSKIEYFLNTFFTAPLFIYAYFISDFSNHPPLAETIYHSTGWLLAGAFVLIYFSKSDSRIILYAIVSVLTLVVHLQKANNLFASFVSEGSLFTHPLVSFTLLFTGAFIVRYKYRKSVLLYSDKFKSLSQSISQVFRDSVFPVAEIRAEQDSEGNVTDLRVEKVNNAFQAAFKINQYEVKNQEANFIFELIFREPFDLNKILLFNNQRNKEIHLKKTERWYKLHILKPKFDTFYVILEDITKAKNKIAELENNKKRYKVLLEAIPDMFFVIGKDGIYEDFVIKESDLFKVEDANIVGSSIFDVGFPPNMAQKIKQCIHNCLKNNSLETIEYSLKTHHGTYIFEMRLAKLNARSVISVARDITRRKNAEFNLDKARKKAEESDKLKSAFLTNLSHEIRTPLNIITNFTRMLNDGDLGNSERTELSDAISQNGTQLLNMINNTIHLSKIETDSVDMSISFCKINPLMRDLYNHFKALIPDGRNIIMNMDMQVPNPSFGFNTDSRLLKETLYILVDNAIKYTLKGEINFRYEMMRNEEVKFIISDTGIGIPEDEIENIFSRFYRIKNEINEITSGSGIGLPIAQHYITLLGGELQIKTATDKGTTFWFSLPFREGEGYLRVVS